MEKSRLSGIVKFIFLISLIVVTGSCGSKRQAKWITIGGDAGKPDQWLCFRKSFMLSDSVGSDLAQIAVDTKYWLWVNDSLVIRDGALLRNANPQDTWYDEVELAPFLHRGANSIAILVNYYGRDGQNHNSSGRAGLYFNSGLVKSDTTWSVAVHPAFFEVKDAYPNYRYAVQDVGFNANRDIAWTKPGFDDSRWSRAVEAGSPPTDPWHHLIRREIPQFRDYGLSSFLKTERHGDTIIAFLPYDAQVNPYFRIRAKKNQEVSIWSDTYSLGNLRHHNSIQTEYICRQGLQEFEMPHWISGHKIYFVIPSGAVIEALMYRETGYDTDLEKRFVCSDPFLNKLWDKAQRTIYVCTREYFMDCPDRERTQYGGDVANMINQSFFTFDTSIYSLDRKSILGVFNWQRADSTIYMPYGGTANEELPLQMLSLTGYHGIYQYLMYTGDTATIRRVFP
ncbi:MAG TPA: glycoside hydrolase, partial [Bacteroidales bacterium]|nr:glycoside hydrolase [Bacteroidales bacterium]